MNYIKQILCSLLIVIASGQTLRAIEAVPLSTQFAAPVGSTRELFVKVSPQSATCWLTVYVGAFLLFVGGVDDGRLGSLKYK